MVSALKGRLNMISATIDWRDETARCVGVFRSEDAMALEVEYRVHLDEQMLDLLAKTFLQAGVPILRGSEATTPAVRLFGQAPEVHEPPAQRFHMDGTPKRPYVRRKGVVDNGKDNGKPDGALQPE